MKLLLLSAVVFLIVSCTPTVYYLGDSYQKTHIIDVYYDESDIDKEYKTIGQLTHDKTLHYSVEELKTALIEKAKQVGADGIIFLDTSMTRNDSVSSERLEIKSKLIKYTN